MKTPEQYEAEIKVLVSLIEKFTFERTNWYRYIDAETHQEMTTNCTEPKPYMKDYEPTYYVFTDLTPEDVEKTLSSYQAQAEVWRKKEAVVEAAIRWHNNGIAGLVDTELELHQAVEALEEG